MGNLSNNIKTKNLSTNIIFLKDFLTTDKVEILKFINEDYLIDEETFCSFFLTGENYFRIFDVNDTGLISVWEILTMIFILKNSSFKTKINNILDLFVFPNPNNESSSEALKIRIKADELWFAIETILIVLEKIFSIHIFLSTEVDQTDFKKEAQEFCKNIFHEEGGEEKESVLLHELKTIFEKDDNLFIIFNDIYEKSRIMFEQ
jgi:hypothetical protein